MKTLLELRKKIKSNNPNFMRQEWAKRPKLAKKWRQPKGIQSKLRRRYKGHGFHPSPGYSSPAAVRGLNKDGLERKMVANVSQLVTLNPKTHIAVIVSSVGKRLRADIAKKAIEMKLQIENMKDATAFLKTMEEMMQKKKSAKDALKKAKEAEEKKKLDTKAEKKKHEHLHDEKGEAAAENNKTEVSATDKKEVGKDVAAKEQKKNAPKAADKAPKKESLHPDEQKEKELKEQKKVLEKRQQ